MSSRLPAPTRNQLLELVNLALDDAQLVMEPKPSTSTSVEFVTGFAQHAGHVVGVLAA
jgi:hypothetical protein